MTDTNPGSENPNKFPSVDDVKPDDEGGPLARAGFSCQDEVAVSFLIDLLEDPSLLKVHCETHDDVVLVYHGDEADTRLAEFVQVKANEPDKLWSVADLCTRKKGKPGTSIFEISLLRDKHCEEARFRLVTLRPAVSELKFLTFPSDAPGRESDGEHFKNIENELERRFPGLKSQKGNGAEYWLKYCTWDQRHSEETVGKDNVLRLMRLSAKEGSLLLPEFADILVDDLRSMVKAAGDARWEPDRDKKIFTRETVINWWERRKLELTEVTTTTSGQALRKKMTDAGLPSDLVELAIELRREYAAATRTSRYMESSEQERLQSRVKAEVMSLRAQLVAGNLDLEASGFHSLCLERMDAVNAERPADAEDQSAFLKGCMYDITDRCLLRFERPAS